MAYLLGFLVAILIFVFATDLQQLHSVATVAITAQKKRTAQQDSPLSVSV